MKLRELFEDRATNIVAVMAGGFHPFHPGHKSLYDWSVETFGKDNVYVAATNDTKSRPFPFDVKQKLASMAGVPANRFIQVKSPFNALSYDNILGDSSKTALVFVRSEKDKTSHPLPDQVRKSDGNMGYLISYKGNDDLETADTHGYLAYGPTIDFDFSGMSIKSASELRATWSEMSDEDKLKAAELMYPGNAQTATKLLNQALGDPEAPVGESLEENKVKSTLPDKIEVRKPQNPPKAPDATIPRNRNGYTKDDGTVYKQDKYNDNIMHVSDGSGTYTFDDARLIKWQTSMIDGLKYTYDYVQRKIKLDYSTIHKTDDGESLIDQSAMYDMKGNKIEGSESTSVSGGAFSAKVDKSGTTVKNGMFDPFNKVTMIVKSNPEKLKKYGVDKFKAVTDKYQAYLQQSLQGRAMPDMDHKAELKKLMAIADVKFRNAQGTGITAQQAIKGAQGWWDSLNKTNQRKNADIAKMRAPQKPADAEQ